MGLCVQSTLRLTTVMLICFNSINVWASDNSTPTASISWSPSTVNYGETSTVTWNSTNTTSCTLAGVPNKTSGSWVGKNRTKSFESTLICTGHAGQTVQAKARLTVNPKKTTTSVKRNSPVRVRRFEWEPSVVAVGEAATFHWHVDNVQSCFGNNKARTPTGNNGLHRYSKPQVRHTQWYCTDLQGNRYPANPNQFIQAKLTVTGAVNNPAAEINQYATSVINFSSQYSTSNWSTAQALGEPNTFNYGDLPTSWAPAPRNGGSEYITVGFTTPVFATGATIRETYGNGFVYRIDAIEANGASNMVWSGTDSSQPGSPANFNPTWPQTDYLVTSLKIYVDTNHNLSTWEEIDSIQLHGNAFAMNPPSASPNVKPTITSASPANNSSYSTTQNVTASANARDSDGSIKQVQFKLSKSGGAQGSWQSDNRSPYSKNFGKLSAGNYTLSYRAKDNDNAYSTVSQRRIVVTESPSKTTLFIHTDILGSPVAKTNTNGGLK